MVCGSPSSKAVGKGHGKSSLPLRASSDAQTTPELTHCAIYSAGRGLLTHRQPDQKQQHVNIRCT
jgi:hypothetical protein